MGIDTARGDWEVQFAYWLQARSHIRALHRQVAGGSLSGGHLRALASLTFKGRKGWRLVYTQLSWMIQMRIPIDADQLKPRAFHFALLLTLASGAIPRLSAAPVITGVVNAASYKDSRLPGAGIAPGSIFIVTGSGLGPANIAVAPAAFQSTSLSGTSVKVTVNATTVDALMYYTSATQVAALLPSNTPPGGVDGANPSAQEPSPLHTTVRRVAQRPFGERVVLRASLPLTAVVVGRLS